MTTLHVCIIYKVPYSVDTSNLSASAIASLPKDLSFTLKFDFHKRQRKVKMESKEMLEREHFESYETCLLYTSPSPRDGLLSRMPSSA